jgi:S1-C subfamily serine protease
MRFVASLCVALIAATLTAELAQSQDAHDPLRFYAVTVGADHGVYLGNGLVITAAHAADNDSRVYIGGATLPSKLVKRDNQADLLLLSIDAQLPARLGLRHVAFCQTPPKDRQPVLVAIPEGVVRSNVLSPFEVPPDIATKFPTTIQYVDPGNSGTGVFDADKKCLMGIITRKISLVKIKHVDGREVREPHAIAKYFVPATEIVRFLPPEVRF